MGGEHAQVFIDAPDMQVVNTADAVYGVKLFHHFFYVDILRCALQQNVNGLAENAPGVPQNEQADQNTDEWVKPVPFCEVNKDTRDNRAERGHDISHQMEEGAAQVEVVFAAFFDHQRGDEVDDKSDSTNSDQKGRVNFGRGQEAFIGFEEDPERDQDQRCGVDQGDENSNAMIAECFASMGGLRGEMQGIPTESQCDDVRKVVRRIGEKGKAVAEETCNDFNDHKCRSENQRKSEAFGRLLGEVTDVRMSVGMIMHEVLFFSGQTGRFPRGETAF